MNRFARIAAVACVVSLTATAISPAQATVEMSPTELVSAGAHGSQGNGYSYDPRLSASGRFVAFFSAATNLVEDDTNGVGDVFVKDVSDGSIERVSVDEQGHQLLDHSSLASISADGRYVLFTHSEHVEDADGGNYLPVVRLTDLATGTSRRVEKRAPNGNPIRFHGPKLTGNGRYMLFSTARPLVRGDRGMYEDVYRLELATGALRRVSVPSIDGSGASSTTYGFSVSHSGRFVALLTTARLLKRDRRADEHDVYIRDMRKSRPQLVSQSSSGVQATAGSMDPMVSANGRYVLFTSRARNLVRGDTNRKQDVFVRDLRTGTTKRISLSGRERQGDHHSSRGVISNDGRFVVFNSRATNLAPGTTDFGASGMRGANIFVRDRWAGTTTAITMAPDGDGANSPSSGGVLSTDGSTVAFYSQASNLIEGVSGDHIFLRRLRSTRD